MARSRGFAVPWFLIVLVVLVAGGWLLWRKVIAGEGRAHLTCRLNQDNVVYKITFKSPPANAQDVRLVLTSDQMVESGKAYEWREIAEQAKLPPDAAPPVDREIKFVVQLAPPAGIMRAKISDPSGYPVLTAKLYWGGALQDVDRSNLSAHYERQ